jgi:hypothetical protein
MKTGALALTSTLKACAPVLVVPVGSDAGVATKPC